MVAIASQIERWAHFYEDHKAVSAGVTYVHLAGVLMGGGLAIAADRASLRLAPFSPDAKAELERIGTVHRLVIAGLVISLLTGLLMMFADLKTYLPSVLFWTKMGLIALLAVNGAVRLRAERALGNDAAAGWRAFRITSAVSLVLWFAILLAGSYL
ncbi:MAG: hypothetical protein ACHQU1_09820, partial [Gemmatimonadales bacterium]